MSSIMIILYLQYDILEKALNSYNESEKGWT